MCSPAIMPPLWLSVATKLRCWSELRSESMTTTGTPDWTAPLTGWARARESRGARTMPETRLLAKFSTTWICWSRSSSRRGPFQKMRVLTPLLLSSCSALTAPAWTDFQNSWVVPLGMTAKVKESAAVATATATSGAIKPANREIMGRDRMEDGCGRQPSNRRSRGFGGLGREGLAKGARLGPEAARGGPWTSMTAALPTRRNHWARVMSHRGLVVRRGSDPSSRLARGLSWGHATTLRDEARP